MTTTKKAPAKKVTAVKKAPAKKSSVKPKRVLARAEGPQCFWVNDGEILSDLVEFANALAIMEAEVFNYHVKGKKNDFANWIEFVLGDTELAAALRKSQKQSTMHQTVVRRLKIYDF